MPNLGQGSQPGYYELVRSDEPVSRLAQGTQHLKPMLGQPLPALESLPSCQEWVKPIKPIYCLLMTMKPTSIVQHHLEEWKPHDQSLTHC